MIEKKGHHWHKIFEENHNKYLINNTKEEVDFDIRKGTLFTGRE